MNANNAAVNNFFIVHSFVDASDEAETDPSHAGVRPKSNAGTGGEQLNTAWPLLITELTATVRLCTTVMAATRYFVTPDA